jgi:drug/metabolite transporter (DMT)-like permease
MRRDASTIAVFAAVVLIGGLNPVAVRFSDAELAPLWGAGVRLALAAVILVGVSFVRRAALPRGRALVGVVLYGHLGFGAFFGFLYWGLVDAPSATASVGLSLVPLTTLVLAPLHGLERFRWQALAGAVVSVGGVLYVFADQLRADVPPLSVIAVLVGCAALAESTIVVKRFPRSDPAITNAIGLAVGAVVVLAFSAVAREAWVLPERADTQLAIAYLVLFGSVLLFMGFLYVLARWTASAASYQLLFMPLVTLPAAAFLRREAVSVDFLVGGAVVLTGVYLGAFAAPIRLPWRWARPVPPPAPGSAAIPAIASADGPGQITFVPPSCP